MTTMRKRLVCVTCSVWLLWLGGCYRHIGDYDQAAELRVDYAMARKVENLVYTQADWPQPLRADLYLPAKQGLLPVVITVHGGGWANRHRDDMRAIGTKLVAHGYAVLNISYRFAPGYTYPAQLHDLQQALRWIAAEAQTYHLDLGRINSWGYSSGAHLAALAGGYRNAQAASGEPTLPRINAVVAGGIPSDLRKFHDSPIVTRFLGGDQREIPQSYADASPVFHVSADDPPVFLYHGNLDLLVSDDHATDYFSALRAAGVASELYLHHWRGHLTMFQFGGDAEAKAIRFLDRYN